MKIQRNQPCPCLSGKKFKRCCGSEEMLAEKRRLDHDAFIAAVKAKAQERKESEAQFPRYTLLCAAAALAGAMPPPLIKYRRYV